MGWRIVAAPAVTQTVGYGVLYYSFNVDGAGHLHGAAAVEAGGPAHALLAVLDRAGRHTGVRLTAGPVASDNRRYAAAGHAVHALPSGPDRSAVIRGRAADGSAAPP